MDLSSTSDSTRRSYGRYLDVSMTVDIFEYFLFYGPLHTYVFLINFLFSPCFVIHVVTRICDSLNDVTVIVHAFFFFFHFFHSIKLKENAPPSKAKRKIRRKERRNPYFARKVSESLVFRSPLLIRKNR